MDNQPEINSSPINPWKNVFKYSHNEERILEQLKNFPPFSELSKKDLKLISKIVHIREYNPNEPIYIKGDPGVCSYLIEEGNVELFFDKTPKNQLSILNPGDYLGEMNLFIECERTETAIALTETKVLIIFRPDMLELIKKEQKIGLKILLETFKIFFVKYKSLNENFYRLYEFLHSNKNKEEDKNES